MLPRNGGVGVGSIQKLGMESYPAYVGAVQVLSGEDPDPVEVLVDQLQHLVVKGGWLGAGDGLWAGNLST